jgi:hypothetical protein
MLSTLLQLPMFSTLLLLPMLSTLLQSLTSHMVSISLTSA